MGWAARAKQSHGNPTPASEATRFTFIDAKKFDQARRTHQPLRAQFSDREYAMDAHGTLRRARPMLSATYRYQTPAVKAVEGEPA